MRATNNILLYIVWGMYVGGGKKYLFYFLSATL